MTGSDSRRIGTDVRASKNSLGGAGAGMRASYENPIPEEDEHVELGAFEPARNTAGASPMIKPQQMQMNAQRPGGSGLPAAAKVTHVNQQNGRPQSAAPAKAAA